MSTYRHKPSYIVSIAGDIYRATNPDTNVWPDNEDALWLGYAVLCLVKGIETTSRDVHEAWAAWAVMAHNDRHKSLVPFDKLTPEIQAYDDLYRDAIHTVAWQLGAST